MKYNLANIIRNRRIEMNISQSELSRRTGIDRTTISKIEMGERKKPVINTLIKLSRVLNIDLRELMYLARYSQYDINNFFDDDYEDEDDEYFDEYDDEEEEYEGLVNYVITIDGGYKIKGKTKEEILREASKEICDRFYSLVGKSENFDKMMEFADVDITTTYMGENY